MKRKSALGLTLEVHLVEISRVLGVDFRFSDAWILPPMLDRGTVVLVVTLSVLLQDCRHWILPRSQEINFCFMLVFQQLGEGRGVERCGAAQAEAYVRRNTKF